MSGNGTDLGHIIAMLQGVLQAQQAMRGDMQSLRTELRGEIAALRSDHGHKLDDLRQTLTQYHASVLGHGILISELDARLRRVEHRMELLPAA